MDTLYLAIDPGAKKRCGVVCYNQTERRVVKEFTGTTTHLTVLKWLNLLVRDVRAEKIRLIIRCEGKNPSQLYAAKTERYRKIHNELLDCLNRHDLARAGSLVIQLDRERRKLELIAINVGMNMQVGDTIRAYLEDVLQYPYETILPKGKRSHAEAEYLLGVTGRTNQNVRDAWFMLDDIVEHEIAPLGFLQNAVSNRHPHAARIMAATEKSIVSLQAKQRQARRR